MSLVSNEGIASFAAANNEFAVRLYQELRRSDGNLFFSPSSVRSALIMAYAGARGRTAYQMTKVLCLPEAESELLRIHRRFEEAIASRSKDGALELDIANALWRQTDLPLLSSYGDLLRETMGAELCEADFAGSPAAAGRAINEWAKTKTRGRIAVLTDPASIDRLTRLVLATAVFFEGTWALPFPKAETRPAPFRPSLSSGTIQVPTMHLEEEFNYARLEGFQVVELPYLGGEMSMAIFLPDAPDGWTDLENRLSSLALSRWFGHLRKERIKVALPKFQSGSSFRLDDALDRAGLRDAFDPGLADFGGMTSQKPLNLGSVAHAAKVEVDEAGTRAAGVSWATFALGLMPEFQADHPFLFVIRDVPTGAILFMGRVLKPEWRDGARRSDGSKTDHDPDRGSRPRFFDSLLRILGLK